MINTLLMAVGLSADAFAVALSHGAAHPTSSSRVGIGIGRVLGRAGVFGIVALAAPLLGGLLGLLAGSHVAAFDHWIAFGLLAAVALVMVWGACAPARTGLEPAPAAGPLALVLTAIGTSIDAFTAGLSAAMIGVEVLATAAAIGAATFALAVAGHVLGVWLRRRIAGTTSAGRWVGLAGGLVLLGLAIGILIDHQAFGG